MKKVTIPALENAMAASVMGTMDILCQVGITWNYIFERPLSSCFQVAIATLDGRPVRSFNGADIHPHCATASVDATDLILVSSFAGFDTLACADQAGEWLRFHHDRGRTSQTPYAVHRFRKDHNDPQILAAQQRLEADCEKPVDINRLARSCGMSRRSFERRFKSATGEAPLLYLQRLRVETAKRLLESAPLSFNEIAYKVGYEDSSFFRKVFRKHTGLLPREYRYKFRGA